MTGRPDHAVTPPPPSPAVLEAHRVQVARVLASLLADESSLLHHDVYRRRVPRDADHVRPR